MRLYFDLDLRRLVERPGYPNALKGVSHKRGDGESVEIVFCRGATVAAIGTPTEMVYVVKESFEDEPPSPPLVLANTGDWSLGDDDVWRAQLGGDGAAILAFLDGATSRAAFAEFTFTDENGGPTTSQTLTATLNNDLWKGTEGTPLSLIAPEAWLTARSVRYDEEQTLTDPQKAQGRDNIGLGTAATCNTGTAEGDVPLIGEGGKLFSAGAEVETVEAAQEKVDAAVEAAADDAAERMSDHVSATDPHGDRAYADSLVVGLLDDRGNYDASSDTYPSSGGSGEAGAILKGDLWVISVGGTLGGSTVTPGDAVRALTDTPGQSASNWVITENNIGYVPENSANKSTDIEGDKGSNTKFPALKAIYDWAVALFARRMEPRSADFTAIVGGRYQTTAALVVADPATRPDGSPLQDGDSYEIWIGGGNATIGGASYAPSRFPIGRIYTGSEWATPLPRLSDDLTLAAYTEGFVNLGNSGTSQTLSLVNGTFQTVTLTGNCTFAMPPATAGKSFVLKVMTGAGGFTGAFTGVRWPENTAPIITTTAARYDLISFLADGSAWSGSAVQNYQ